MQTKGTMVLIGEAGVRPIAMQHPEQSIEVVFFDHSSTVCHSEDGQGGLHGGAALTSQLTIQKVANTMVSGRGDMPAFGRMYNAEQVQDIAS